MMKKLFGLAAIGGIGWGLRKLMGKKAPDTTAVDMDQPQKATEKVEAATGVPVRP